MVSCSSLRRIIPADAGSTSVLNVAECFPQDHPRGCGEHDMSVIGRMISSGSSPRMRGALAGMARVVSVPGIIPADAGSTDTGIRFA